MKRAVAVRVLRFSIGALLLAAGAALIALGAVRTFPEETRWFSVFLQRERNGCTLVQALSAIRYTAGHRRLLAQLEQRSRILRIDPEGRALWQTPLGEYWVPEKQGEGFLFVLAEIEKEPYATPNVHVQKGDVVLDCGAYVGMFTRKALVAGASRVVAIEPSRNSMECLKRNFAAEIATGRVVMVEQGVWDREGQLEFHGDSVTASFVLFATNSAATRVPVTTIDKLVSKLDLPRVDFIKMDIEGSEQQALSGAREILARFRPRLAIASYHRPDDSVRIPALVRRANARYSLECAGCRLDLDLNQIRPLTMFFH